MKFKFIIYTIIFLSLVTPVFATGSGTITNSSQNSKTDDGQDVIQLELIQEIQNPKTKELEYTLRIKTLVDTNRLRINWEIVNGRIKIEKGYKLTDAVDIQKGQDVYITKRFNVAAAGNEEIRITAFAFGPKDDYYSFTNTKFSVNKFLEVAPNRKEYSQAKSLMNFLSQSQTVLIIADIVLVLFLCIWRFKKWLDAD